MKSMNILSITPHLGGGAGTCIKTWILKEQELHMNRKHTVVSLDINKTPVDPSISLYEDMHNNIPEIMNLIKKTDIVLIHWWNHPMLFDLLLNYSFPKCRIAMWSLASCLFPPYVHSEDLLEFSDKFVFSSPVSYRAKEIQDLPQEQKNKLDMIWASCDITRYKDMKREPHDNFNIGTIIGSADYSKLNTKFVELCAEVNIPNAIFHVVCSESFSKQLEKDIKRVGLSNKILLHTNVPDIYPYLKSFDIFSYPLQPYHFGTCEIAIGEAMISGLAPVVLNNPSENYIVDHEITGFIANSKEEYANYIEFLYNNPKTRKEMSKKASNSAIEKYSVETVMYKWGNTFNSMMNLKKVKRDWRSDNEKLPGSLIFAEALGNYKYIFYDNYLAISDEQKKESSKKISELFKSNPQWGSENKGGIKQYLKIFPYDKHLQEWEKLL